MNQPQPVSNSENKPMQGDAIENKTSSTPADKQKQETLQPVVGCLVLILIGFSVWLTFHFLFSGIEVPSGPAIVVSASELYAAFENHEIKADDTYKDKKVRVTGVVQSIEAGGLFTTESVILSNGNPFNPFGIGCYWNSGHRDQLRQIEKGQIVTIEGVCLGRTLGIVGVHESRLVE